jgi:hypothetical protein
MLGKLFFAAILTLLLNGDSLYAQALQKNRVIILSDIEADPDDTQSFVRLLLYSNQIDIRGMIATTSCWQQNRIAPESIKKIIRAYGKVQPNLLKHEAGFPGADALLSMVKNGPALYGMKGVGEGKDSPGSEWIIKVLEEKDERPLWISVWGGANTLAQALHKIQKTRTTTEANRLVSKLRVYTISDQDDSGNWMRNTFPGLFYIVTPGDDYSTATWTGISAVVKGIDNSTVSNTWLAENIQQGHGPLGAAYPDVSWAVEGDTPAFLSLIPNGLNDAGHPDRGGWGGRYEFYQPDFATQKKGRSDVPLAPETRAIWTNATDTYIPFAKSDFGRVVKPDSLTFKDNKVTLWRWREDFQNDFAARMDWCLADYKKANHPPVAVVKPAGEITVKSGDEFSLDGSGSSDPDGDSFSYLWFHYPEAGSYIKEIKISPENYPGTTIKAPEVEKKETAHFILKITDKGTPRLSRYKRVIVTILPK